MKIQNDRTLDNVRSAVERADVIMKKNIEKGYRLYEYKGYRYYKENPPLAVNEIVDKILKDFKLMLWKKTE